MANTIANSSAGNSFFTMGGSAVGSTTQPRINQSVMAGVLDTSLSAPGHIADSGFVPTYTQVPYTGYDKVSVINGLTNTLRGSSNTSLRNPASDYFRESIMQADAVRTVKRASAIRANQWNPYTGGYTTLSGANDFAALGNDVEGDSNRAIPGYFAWNYAGSGIREAYSARTQ